MDSLYSLSIAYLLTRVVVILCSVRSHGVRADYVDANVGKVAEVDVLWAKVIELYPQGIDILVNNAGLSIVL